MRTFKKDQKLFIIERNMYKEVFVEAVTYLCISTGSDDPNDHSVLDSDGETFDYMHYELYDTKADAEKEAEKGYDALFGVSIDDRPLQDLKNHLGIK